MNKQNPFAPVGETPRLDASRFKPKPTGTTRAITPADETPRSSETVVQMEASRPARREPTQEELRSVAQATGFVERNPTVVKSRRKREPQPKQAIHFLMEIPHFNRFVDYCDEHRLSYHEGVIHLLDRVEAQSRKKSDNE
jgi:hypothetical protein